MPVFTTAQLAMSASQRALDVVGQILQISIQPAIRDSVSILQKSVNFKNGSMYSNGPAKVGYGVEITGISQLRDPYLDAQYRTQIAKLGTTDANMPAGLEQLSTVFDETVKDGVRDALPEYFSPLLLSFQSMSESRNLILWYVPICRFF